MNRIERNQRMGRLIQLDRYFASGLHWDVLPRWNDGRIYTVQRNRVTQCIRTTEWYDRQAIARQRLLAAQS